VGKRVELSRRPLLAQLGAFSVLGVCFFLGGVLGCLFVGHCGVAALESVHSYLTDYLALVQNSPPQPAVSRLLLQRLCAPALLFLLSVTPFRRVGLPALFLGKGFLLSFSVSCFARIFGVAGLPCGLLLFGVPALFWVPALFLLGVKGFSLSTANGRQKVGCLSGFGWGRLGVALGLLLACVCVEYACIPAWLGWAAGLISAG
jgi:hypothetical protein